MRPKFIIPALLIVFSSGAFAQRFQARFVTSAYAWERQDTVGKSSNHLYGFQSIQLSLAGKDLSFHSYLQGFNDFAGPSKNDPQLKFYNFYLNWRNIANLADLTLGRQPIYAGVGVGTIDGGKTTFRFLDSRLRATAYYGSLVPAGQKMKLIDDAKDNSMFGGQLLFIPHEVAQVSVSYLNRDMKPSSYKAFRRDSLFNPYLTEIRPSVIEEEYLGGDLNLELFNKISVFGRYDYDLIRERMDRAQIFARVSVIEKLAFTGEYLQREPRLSYNSIFSVFTFNTLTEYEGGIEYRLNPSFQIFAKYGAVSYGDDDHTKRITAGFNGKYFSGSLTRNTGFGGDLSGGSLNIGYPLFDNIFTPTLGVSYAQYKLSEYSSKLDDVLAVGVGGVYRPNTSFSLDCQLQWINNKVYQNDIRLMVRGSYSFSEYLSIF